MSTIVAQTIAAQIGQRAFFMMGTINKLAGKDSLVFNLRDSPKRVSKIRVTLDPSDTYTLEFWSGAIGRRVPELLHKSEGVYADGLHQSIEIHTGLCLSIGRPESERGAA